MNSYLKDIINNQGDIAFVIGNGVNLRFFSDVKSWMKLLELLWNKYCIEDPSVNNWKQFVDSGTGKLRGITQTELFDFIELSCFENLESSYGKETSSKVPIRLKEIDAKLREGLKEFASMGFTKKRNELFHEFDNKNSVFMERCREWCKLNFMDADTLSGIDCMIKMTELLSDHTKIQLYRNQLKKEIAKEYIDPKNHDGFSHLLKVLKGKKAPILTTNFDTYMSSSLLLEKKKMGTRFTDFYPWNVYFSDEDLNSPVSGFGIWHINGLINYPRSIKLGLSDYMGCVERARNMIHSTNMNEFFDGKNHDSWVGHNTWLHIFNKDLFIFGLALDENEVFLRWLLIQRAKYSKMYHCRLKGWFVDKNISEGKRGFLETLGFTVISVSDYDELYNAIC